MLKENSKHWRLTMFDRVIKYLRTPYVVSFLISAFAALAVRFLTSPKE